MKRRRVHRVSMLVALGTIPLLLAGVLVLTLYKSTPAARPNQLIPLYQDNANDWATACSSVNGTNGGSFIIADVDGALGPGPAPVPAWAKVIDRCNRYGRGSVLGYVWTDYGKRGTAALPAVEAQVKAWYSFYPGQIGGIFFDGASDSVPGTGASNRSFYQSLDYFVHANEGKDEKVVLNYGANPGSGWMFSSSNAKNANIVVIFEGSYSTAGENPYVGGGWTPASWESRYPADDFAALVYNANSTATTPQPATACAALSSQHIGYLYVGTRYSDLAPYFSTFVSDC